MIRPLVDYVIIEPIEDDTKLSSGLYAPDSSKDKPSKGIVIDEGEVSKVKKGQTVVYKKFTNQEVTHEGKTYLIVKYDELLAVIE